MTTIRTKPQTKSQPNAISNLVALVAVMMRLRLFLALVWREWEPKSCGIPDEYRIHYRLTVRDAWSIASGVWAHNDRGERPERITPGAREKGKI